MSTPGADGGGIVSEAELSRLRAKYAAMSTVAQLQSGVPAAVGEAAVPPAFSTGSVALPVTAATAVRGAPGSVVDRLRICRACGGSGATRQVYNHMMMERTCVECDGDGVRPMEARRAPEATGGAGPDAAPPGGGERAGTEEVPPLE